MQEKRAVLLHFVRSVPSGRFCRLPAQPVHDASGKLFLTEPYRRTTRAHTLLGETRCTVAVRALTRPSTKLHSAGTHTEKTTGIWNAVEELHEQNPCAKCESHGLQSLRSLQSGSHPSDKKWNMPLFHQKICLWRLVKKLHVKGQVGVSCRRNGLEQSAKVL